MEKLAALAAELDRELRRGAPEDPDLAAYAAGVLDNYLVMARHGFFPAVHTEDEDL